MHFQTTILLAIAAAQPLAASALRCKYITNPSPPPALHCEQYGTLKNPSVLSSSSSASFDLCRNSCLAHKACVSFGYTASSKACTFLTKPLDQQGFKQTSATSGPFYANRHCYSCQQSTTTTTSSIVSSTTTSSSSTTTSAPLATPTFQIQAANSGTAADGTFLVSEKAGGPGALNYMFFDASPSLYADYDANVETFTLDPSTGYVYDYSGTNQLFASSGLSGIIIGESAAGSNNYYDTITCTIDPDTQYLSCSGEVYGQTYSGFSLQSESLGEQLTFVTGASTVDLVAVPVF